MLGVFHLAVRFGRVTDLQRRQQFHAVCVLVMRDGERDGRHAVFRVVGITENRLNHHFFLRSVDFVHSGPQVGIFTLPTDEAMLWIGTSFATLKKCATMNLRRVAGKVWGKDWGIPMPQ